MVNFFADDNLDADKTAAVREAWGGVVGTPDDLLSFLLPPTDLVFLATAESATR